MESPSTLNAARVGLTTSLRGPALAATAAVVSGVALVVRDPHQPGAWGACPFLTVTGWYCPFCGGLRATNDLLHGRVLTALQDNVLALFILAVGAFAWLLWTHAALDGRRVSTARVETRTAVLVGAAVLIAFTVARNTVLPGLTPA